MNKMKEIGAYKKLKNIALSGKNAALLTCGVGLLRSFVIMNGYLKLGV
jgi:hypothetical protein